MKFLENRIPPPLIALALGLGMWWLTKWQAPLPLAHWLRIPLTVLLGLCAFAIAFSGFLALRRANTTVDPIHVDRASALVTGGAYRITRNPMYVGLAIMLTAWAVWLAVPWAFIGPVLLVLYTYRFQILPEEKVMEAKFGADYLAYKERVRRWL